MNRSFPETGYDLVTGEWNDSLLGDFLWSNVNVSEAVPDVMTPSTWSLWWIHHYEANPFKFPSAYPFCGNICGRPYLNLSLLVSVYRAIGRDVRKELQGDMIGSVPADIGIPAIPFSKFKVYRTMLPGLIKTQAQAQRDQKSMAGFLGSMPDWCRATRRTIAECPNAPSLWSLWLESIKPVIVRACRMLRSVTLRLADPATKLHLELSALVGETEANALLSNFSGAAADLESLGLLVGLAKVRDGKMTGAEYMKHYGHRGPHEMELFASGSDDDPDWFDKQWANFTRSTVDADALLAKQRADSLAAWQRFETRYPGKVEAVRKEADKVAAAARNREAVRSEVTRVARLVRRYALRVGEVTDIGEDVFFLSLDEMATLLQGERTVVTYIPARHKMYDRYSALPPYPPIIIGRFDPFRWAVDPNRRSDYFDSRTSTRALGTSTIKGFAGAAGCVEGLVRRIDCVEEGNHIQPGEILVTITTNVGWTPLFPRLAAIVTDVGAPLSHAAIVARELGIPAVVGCGNASMLLKTGDRVRVDGGRGVVELMEKS
jgi:pyruvate,water dikinase